MKRMESAAIGFFAGAGFDAIMKVIAKKYYLPLGERSPIKFPGYDPEGVHYDDLLVVGTSAGIAGIGAYKKNYDLAIAGASMALGSYVLSAVLKG